MYKVKELNLKICFSFKRKKSYLVICCIKQKLILEPMFLYSVVFQLMSYFPARFFSKHRILLNGQLSFCTGFESQQEKCTRRSRSLCCARSFTLMPRFLFRAPITVPNIGAQSPVNKNPSSLAMYVTLLYVQYDHVYL